MTNSFQLARHRSYKLFQSSMTKRFSGILNCSMKSTPIHLWTARMKVKDSSLSMSFGILNGI